jgi:hypothetical protein
VRIRCGPATVTGCPQASRSMRGSFSRHKPLRVLDNPREGAGRNAGSQETCLFRRHHILTPARNRDGVRMRPVQVETASMSLGTITVSARNIRIKHKVNLILSYILMKTTVNIRLGYLRYASGHFLPSSAGDAFFKYREES